MNTPHTAWNTGRTYDRHGQRIAATILEDKRCAFVDIDQGISGITKDTIPNFGTIKAFVMEAYDGFDGYDCYIEDKVLEQELGDLARQVKSR
jgi:hypothetical protein